MSWTPNQREIQGVLSLGAPERYEHWVKKVADQERGVESLAGRRLGPRSRSRWTSSNSGLAAFQVRSVVRRRRLGGLSAEVNSP